MDSPTYQVPRTPKVDPGLTHHTRMRYNGCMLREALSTRRGGLKARSGNGLATPISKVWKVWRAALASQGPGLCPDQAVGLDQPELKPLEKAAAEGGGLR